MTRAKLSLFRHGPHLEGRVRTIVRVLNQFFHIPLRSASSNLGFPAGSALSRVESPLLRSSRPQQCPDGTRRPARSAETVKKSNSRYELADGCFDEQEYQSSHIVFFQQDSPFDDALLACDLFPCCEISCPRPVLSRKGTRRNKRSEPSKKEKA